MPHYNSPSRTLARAVRPIIEALEGRRLLAADPLAYANVVQNLPFALDFTRQVNGLPDTTGQAIGFTRVQANRIGNQYQPSLIHLNTGAGELDVSSQSPSSAPGGIPGTNYGTDNTLVNGLETEFDASTQGFTITARVKGPLSQLNNSYDGATVYFGPDQDNYVKLDAEYDAAQGGQVLQFTDEQTGTTHTINTYTKIGSFTNIQTLDLRLTGNAATGMVTASYSLNGGTYVSVSGTVALTDVEQTTFFNATARAGIFVATKNTSAPITVPYTHFEIDPGTPITTAPQATVSVIHPADGDVNVSRDQFVSVDFHLPNGGIDPRTISAGTVALVRTMDHSVVSDIVNTTGGNDAIILQPQVLLDPNTSYTFLITSGLKDIKGVPFKPIAMVFTTGAQGGTTDPTLAFQKVTLPTAQNATFVCVRVGADHMLYASTLDGRIFRWGINPDGTLGSPQVISSLKTANPNDPGRTITGFAFDPRSTAANPILWVSNSYYSGDNAWEANDAPDFSGKITVMSGPNLSVVQDAVIDLPRSIRDHMNEQPTFGPDGALYWCQGSVSSSGGADPVWGNRPEHLLTAAILRLDVSKITPGQPLDALTPDAGGTYNPFAPGAALTLYATGVRNAFELLWAQNGKLYAPTNGASAGGNTPAYPNSLDGTRIDTGQPYDGPAVPGVTGLAEAEDDWIFQIQQGGYYGHPDPARGEYVLNGGRPTANLTDPAQIPDYPAGVQPDVNYRGYGFDFGQHRSPDGIIEYQGNAFNGALNGKLFVTEYSGGTDIALLTRDANGNITGVERGIAGLTGFWNPVNLCEDPTTGYLYVSELGGRRITLVRAVPLGSQINVDKTLLAFNDVQSVSPNGAGPSPAQTITITNTGTAPLTFGADGFTLVGPDAMSFAVSNRSNLPTLVQPGQSFQVQLDYTANTNLPAGQTQLQSASLQIKSNDPSNPILSISLHGLATTGLGGGYEPSLAAILRTYNIPTIVGDGPNDSTAFTSTFYPNPPGAGSQETLVQRLAKAGDGPVTIQLLASFNATNSVNPIVRFGYYTPGQPLDKNELFTLNNSDAQLMAPNAMGSTSFDPGSASFGLYSIFPHFQDNGQARVSYSEDVWNAWDVNVHRKFRFFPLENPDGSVVADAYVFAAEDNNIPFGPIQPYDSNDVVGIIRNVKLAADAPNGPVIGLQNLDGVPFSDRLVFNRIQVTNSDQYVNGDVVHDTGMLQVTNSGNQPLVINGLSFTDAAEWQLVNPPTLPATVAPGGVLDLTIKFVAQSAPPHTNNELNDYQDQEFLPVTSVGGVWNDTLTVSTNDPASPLRTVQLAGYWQHHSEYEEEPGLQTIVNQIFGFGTNVSNTPQPQYPNNGKTPVYYGEEVPSAYWSIADNTLPISVRQLDALHNQEYTNPQTNQTFLTQAQIGWFAQGSATTKWLFAHQPRESQSLLPTIYGSTTAPAAGSFSYTGIFGWNLDGEKSDDSLNTTDQATYGRSGHAVRFYPVRDRQGNLVPDEWLVVMDYQNGAFDNSDYQDNVYLVTNMRPASQAPAPTDLFATGIPVGVSLTWAELPYANHVTFNVYRAGSTNGTFVKLNAGPVTQTGFLDTSAPSGSTSYYRVTAVDASSGIESVGSNAQATPSGVAQPPTAPSNLTANATSPTSVTLTWTASSGGVTAYHVERSPDGINFSEVAATVFAPTYTDTTAQPGTQYVYRVRAEKQGVFSGYSNPAQVTTPPPQQGGAMSSTDINATQPGSTSVLVDGVDYDVLAGGSAVYGTADGFRYVYKQVSGDFDVKVRIASMTVDGAIDQAGIMARATLDPSSPDVYVSASPSEGYRFKYRPTQGGSTSAITLLTPMTYPDVWVRLQRSGNNFVGYYSTDGVTWTQVSSTPLAMNDPVYLGLATAANAATGTITAQYRSFESTALPVPVASLTAAAPTNKQVSLTWAAAAGVGGYDIQRQGPGDADFVTIAQGITATTYTDATVAEGRSYIYRVISRNAAGIAAEASSASTAAVPILGDANRDGKVGFADLIIVAQHYGSTNATWDTGDFNGDGKVNFADLIAVAQQYGKTAASIVIG